MTREAETRDRIPAVVIAREVAVFGEIGEVEAFIRRARCEPSARLVETVARAARRASGPAFSIERDAERDLVRRNSALEEPRHACARVGIRGIVRIAVER